MKRNKIHAVILARGGSKGIKNKNLKYLNGKPLIYWTIKACKISSKIEKVWVSSDDKKILSISKKYGADIIIRPNKISKDSSSSEEGWLHSAKLLKKKFDIQNLIVLQATSPFRKKSDLDLAIKKFQEVKCDSLFSATELKSHFTWTVSNKKILPDYNSNLQRKNRQNIAERLIENGSFYIFSLNKFLTSKKRLFKKVNYYKQDLFSEFEIDEKNDLEVAKMIFRYLKIKKNSLKFKRYLI